MAAIPEAHGLSGERTRALQAALAPHEVFASDDPSEARERVAEVFCSHSLRALRRDVPLGASQHAASVGDLTVSLLSYLAEVEIRADQGERFFAVQLPLRGRALVTSGARTVTSTPMCASVPTPSEQLRMRLSPGTSQLIVKIPEAALVRRVAALLGRTVDEPLVFDLAMRTDGPTGARLAMMWGLLETELVHSERSAHPRLMQRATEEYVLTTLLLCQPNSFSGRLAGVGRAAGPRYVRRAMAYAAEHAHEPITVGDMAEASGIGVRALQAGFAAATGSSPGAWLRDLRLDRVREDLQASDPAEATVTRIALSWGFKHLGRFSALYERRFGELPSETLRR